MIINSYRVCVFGLSLSLFFFYQLFLSLLFCFLSFFVVILLLSTFLIVSLLFSLFFLVILLLSTFFIVALLFSFLFIVISLVRLSLLSTFHRFCFVFFASVCVRFPHPFRTFNTAIYVLLSLLGSSRFRFFLSLPPTPTRCCFYKGVRRCFLQLPGFFPLHFFLTFYFSYLYAPFYTHPHVCLSTLFHLHFTPFAAAAARTASSSSVVASYTIRMRLDSPHPRFCSHRLDAFQQHDRLFFGALSPPLFLSLS